jgi:hypothetical protein
MNACALPFRFLFRWVPALLAGLALASCTDERQLPLAPRAALTGGPYTISGSVLGPDASSICDFVPSGAAVRVQALDPVNPPLVAGTQNVTCPTNSYSLTVPAGTYRLQAGMPVDPGIGNLPFRYLEPGDVVVSGDLGRDITVENGTALGGTVTLDGSPLAGVGLTLSYDFPQPRAAAFGITGSDGGWRETSPERSHLLLQGGVRYTASLDCGNVPGTRLPLVGPPQGSFLFPTEVSAINCTLVTAPAVAYTHDRTRLVVTSMPASIGGGEPSLFEQYGRGWGVQFPVNPSQGPVHIPTDASHLFNGGLLIGLAPNVVLSGTDLNQEMECGATCRDLGQGASGHITSPSKKGKTIKWTYSDEMSGDGVGLKVVQESFDGDPPADYVILEYTITNQSKSTRTFYAGFWGDWDVSKTVLEDIGFTELDGRLMYMMGDGISVGTLLLGDAPVSGNFFYNRTTTTIPIPLIDQVRALRGDLRRNGIGPGDNRVIHAMGPITLKHNKKAEVRFAIVAGESRAELLANAEAAAADVGQTLPPPTSFQGTVSSASLDFGDTVVVKPGATLPWDGDESVSFNGVPSSYLLDANPDSIAEIVPRLPTGPTDLLVLNQGTEQRIDVLDVTIASSFTAIGLDQLASAPDISGGPFAKTFFIELDNDHRDHFLTVAPAADLPLTVTLDWQTDADLDIYWTGEDGQNYVGNLDGATLVNPERTSFTVPGGETYRLRFSKFGNDPPSLARVTITSP